MNKCEVKELKVSRGFTYSYLRYKNPDQVRPTLLLIHGFPSTALDWVHQINYLIPKGYSIIAPDTLGYGGTSKPVETSAYCGTDIAKDIVEILDRENVKAVICIAHDWGCSILSRIIDFNRQYLTATVFLSVSYMPRLPHINYEDLLNLMESECGSPLFGYWDFFARNPKAHTVIEKNIDSFYSMLFPKDPEIFRSVMAPRGKAQEWLENNKQAPQASYWTDETLRAHQQRLLRGGLESPLKYYAAQVFGINDVSEPIPVEAVRFSTPTLLIPCAKDYVCLQEVQTSRMKEYAENVTVEVFDCSHWIIFDKPDELNETLDKFLDKF